MSYHDGLGQFASFPKISVFCSETPPGVLRSISKYQKWILRIILRIFSVRFFFWALWSSKIGEKPWFLLEIHARAPIRPYGCTLRLQTRISKKMEREISNMKQKIKNLVSTIFNMYVESTCAKYLGQRPSQPRDQFTHRWNLPICKFGKENKGFPL